METLKINFGFFWHGFKNEDNFITRQLSKKFNLQLSDEPDIYFFSHYYYTGKKEFKKYKCHRVFFGGENIKPDWSVCDYVLDTNISSCKRHKYYPLWAVWDLQSLTRPRNADAILKKEKFCCMLVSNPHAKERIAFFNKLSRYKKVDSGGRFLNNIGHPVENKLDFIKDYRFVISFENSSSPGYSTEKLIEPMLVNSIPVYWGDPLVGDHFNTASFINIRGGDAYEAAIEKIIQLDQDAEALRQMSTEPWLKNNQLSPEFSEAAFLKFFDFVIADMKTKKPVATVWGKRLQHEIKTLFQKLRYKAGLQ